MIWFKGVLLKRLPGVFFIKVTQRDSPFFIEVVTLKQPLIERVKKAELRRFSNSQMLNVWPIYLHLGGLLVNVDKYYTIH